MALLLGIPLLACGPEFDPLMNLGVEQGPGSIINGQSEPRFEAVGALTSTGIIYDGHFCSATLIRPDWVLTAAHCRFGGQKDFAIGEDVRPTALLGKPEDVDFYPLGQWFYHPLYYDTGDSTIADDAIDLALVHLQEPVVGVEPIDIAYAFPSFGQSGLTVGYGETHPDRRGISGTRRSVQLPFAWVTENHNVAMRADDGSGCFGDSGGATLVFDGDRPKLLAVTSAAGDEWGNPCTGINISVLPMLELEWMSEVLREPLGCQHQPGVCACEGVCRDDGICDDSACGVDTCGRALECSEACLRGAMGCAEGCVKNLDRQSLQYYQTLQACSDDCREGQPEDPDCFDRCAPHMDTCFADEAPCEPLGGHCAAGTACQPVLTDAGEIVTFECTSSLDIEIGAECDGPEACVDGSSCVEGLCRTNCWSAEECTRQQVCVPIPGQDELGACWQTCHPLKEECLAGSACVKKNADWFCMPSADMPAGVQCDSGSVGDCVAGTMCIEGICTPICDTADGCPDSMQCSGAIFDQELGLATCEEIPTEPSPVDRPSRTEVGPAPLTPATAADDSEGCAQSPADLWVLVSAWFGLRLYHRSTKRSGF